MYNVFGLRWDNREFEVGEEIPVSYNWEDGNCTEEELEGTCAVYVSGESNFLDYLDEKEVAECGELDEYKKWVKENPYGGKNLYLVAIDSAWGYDWGEDESEIIMSGAEVVRKIR